MMNMNSFSEAWPWWFNDQPSLTTQITSTIFIVIFLVITTWLVLSSLVIKKNTTSPPLPPGPKGLPLFGNLLSLDPNLHTHFADISKTYGPIFTLRLGRTLVFVISSPVLAKEVLKDQDTTFANRNPTVAAREATYDGSDLVSSSYGPEWRMLRKVCIREMLSNTNLDSVYDLRRRELRRTIKYLYGKNGSSSVKIGELIFTMMLDVVTSMMWGGTLKGGDEKRVSVGGEFKEVIDGIVGLLMLPNISDFYPFLERFDLQGIRKKMRGLAKKFDYVFESVIDQRIKTEEDGNVGDKDFVQVLLQLQEKDGDGKASFTRTHLKALLMDMVIAGTDTTATTVEFALAELMKKPEVLRKVQEELDQVVGRDRTVEESDINNLPYLHAVMKETLRLHPPLPLLVPHCPNTECNVSGYTISKGSNIYINVWAIQRDPTLWENPTEFLPERFIDAKWDYKGNDFRYLPFGSGRRICAGAAMGERMSMYIVAAFVHSFDWDLPRDEELDMSEKFGIIIRMKSPLVAMATPRLSDPRLYD